MRAWAKHTLDAAPGTTVTFLVRSTGEVKTFPVFKWHWVESPNRIQWIVMMPDGSFVGPDDEPYFCYLEGPGIAGPYKEKSKIIEMTQEQWKTDQIKKVTE